MSTIDNIHPGTIHHIHAANLRTLQNQNAPDFDLERDIVPAELLGAEVGNLQSKKNERFTINLSTIIISAFIFLMILAWFDFLQTAYFFWASPGTQTEQVPPSVKFWYAIIVSILVIFLVYIVNKIFSTKSKLK